MASDPSDTLTKIDPAERVECYIRESLAKADEGDRLPSVRQLMHHCKVSKSAVDRVLSRLQGEGLIEARSRSGLYRSDRSSIRETVVEYLFFGHPDSPERGGFHSEVFYALSSSLSRESKFLHLNIMRREKNPRAIIDRICRNPSCRVITCSVGISDLLEVGRIVDAGIGVLHLLPNFTEPVSSSICLDDKAIVRLQIEHLAGLGHRRVAYLHAAQEDTYYRSVNARRDMFARIAVDAGLDIQPGWIRYVGWDADVVHREVIDLLSADVRPTALIVYDAVVKSVYSAIREYGLVPGRDISVIGCDDRPWAAHVDPPLTTVRVSRSNIAEATCRELGRASAGESVGRHFIPLELIVRKSTAPIAHK